ncbi:hypothetical protein [Streptomyces sp. NBC_01435]|uniref:hypothetical protein n=1 Tax=Streptomyces sp. NBC_01435 TaxID=2903865 RepID=UPI002E37608F|nr:hypothetical protein [Streptomyces sp. NBC_01435]
MISAAIAAIAVRLAFWFRSRRRRRQAAGEQPADEAVAATTEVTTDPGPEEPHRTKAEADH